MTVLFVTRYTPRPVGHGGYHRAYQVLHDLRAAVGADNVRLLSIEQWWAEQGGGDSMAAAVGRLIKKGSTGVARRVSGVMENPLKLLNPTSYSTQIYAQRGFASAYEASLQAATRPVCAVLEHTGFASLTAINAAQGVATVWCPQNIEAFDLTPLHDSPRRARNAVAIDFVNEMHVLGQASERLFISRVETGLIGGLGFPSRYYAYVPVGEIKERSLAIRARRAQATIDRGLFLLMGTAGHGTTRASFSWFLDHARRALPSGIRVVVVGLQTDELAPSPGIEVRGWVEQDELDALLTRVEGVLIPQRLGFGAVTRVSEMACAGIPAIVSPHVGYALDLPPGIHTAADDSWDGWCAAMQGIASRGCGPEEYEAWEIRQPRPIIDIVRRIGADTREPVPPA